MNISSTFSKLYRPYKQEIHKILWASLTGFCVFRINTLALIAGILLFSSALYSQELIKLDDYLAQMEKESSSQKIAGVNTTQTAADEIKSKIFDSQSTIYMVSPETNTFQSGPYIRLMTDAGQLQSLPGRIETVKDQLNTVETFLIKINSQQDLTQVASLTNGLLNALPGLKRVYFMIEFKASSNDLDKLSSMIPKHEDSGSTKTPGTDVNRENQSNIIYLYNSSLPG